MTYLDEQDVLSNIYPYNCFVMTMYQSLLMALVSLPFYVLEGTSVSTFLCTRNCVLKKLKYSFKVLNDDFLMYETQ